MRAGNGAGGSLQSKGFKDIEQSKYSQTRSNAAFAFAYALFEAASDLKSKGLVHDNLPNLIRVQFEKRGVFRPAHR